MQETRLSLTNLNCFFKTIYSPYEQRNCLSKLNKLSLLWKQHCAHKISEVHVYFVEYKELQQILKQKKKLLQKSANTKVKKKKKNEFEEEIHLYYINKFVMIRIGVPFFKVVI